MRRILVTGMSGTGKSTALAALARRGLRVVDTDDAGWGDGMRWDAERMQELLAEDSGVPLVVSGCVENQGDFYDRFDAVVLLTAPRDVLLERIGKRTTNPYGKSDVERALVLEHLETVEPRLRATCTHELDTAAPLESVVAALDAIARGS
jgi:dephospho-CoA kinase